MAKAESDGDTLRTIQGRDQEGSTATAARLPL
jgi:hypothetical protein